jgi:hypothetical protein
MCCQELKVEQQIWHDEDDEQPPVATKVEVSSPSAKISGQHGLLHLEANQTRVS